MFCYHIFLATQEGKFQVGREERILKEREMMNDNILLILNCNIKNDYEFTIFFLHILTFYLIYLVPIS